MEGVQYHGGYLEYRGGYHEYHGAVQYHGDIMGTVEGVQYRGVKFLLFEYPTVLNTQRYSSYPPTVLMIFPHVHHGIPHSVQDIPHGAHDIPPMVLMISPNGTHDIPQWYS